MVVGSLVVSLTGHFIGWLPVLMLLSLYSLAAHDRRRDGLIGLGVGVLCFVGLALLDVPDLGTSVPLQSLALLVAAWALGDAIRSRRLYQHEQLLAAVTEERLRIARELHGVVAYSTCPTSSWRRSPWSRLARRCCTPRVTRRLIQRFAALPAARQTQDDGVTDRERDVLIVVARGLLTQEIAAELHLGNGTVKTHVSHLLTKLECRGRAQLVMYAYESGHAFAGEA